MAPGFVVVSQGLMQMCTSDAELAFVLAHEVAHVVARHVSERQSRCALFLQHSATVPKLVIMCCPADADLPA